MNSAGRQRAAAVGVETHLERYRCGQLKMHDLQTQPFGGASDPVDF